MNEIGLPLRIEANSISSFKSLSRSVSLFVIGVGSLALVGWTLDIALLKSIIPGLASMKSNTALLFILSGVSLWMQLRGQLQRIAQICAFIVAFVALLTLGEYIINRDFGIDQILFRDTTVGVLHPGRMAPATALCFLLIGSAMIFLDNQSRNRFRESLVLTTFAISALAWIGYLYGVSSLYQIGAYSSMALHTALSFVPLSIAILFARPEEGLMQTILADTPGGNILRRLLPVAIVIPILLGWIRLAGQRAGLYDTAFGLALMVTSLITTLIVFICFNARQLNAMDIKRKQVDDSLRASELRFRSTLESMMEGCQIIGYDWRYIYINTSAEKQNRRPNQELLGKIYMDMWPGVESTAVYVGLRQCMAKRIPQHIVNEFIFPDGGRGWFELSIQPVPDGIFILSSDITERKRAEQGLLEREMKLAILLDILPVGISILDAERKVSYTNRALKRILDISDDGLLKGSYRNRKYLRADGTLMPVDELASVRAFEEKREIDDVETGIVKEDDSIVWTDVSAVPVDFTDWKLVMVTSDITERKRVETMRSYLAAVVESSNDAIITKDLTGIITSWNIGAQRIFGYTADEMIGQSILRLIPADHLYEEEHILKQIAQDKVIDHFETVRLTKDGRRVDMSVTASPLKDVTGKVVGVSKVAHDITQRKQAEEEILKLNAELEAKVAERTAELAAANEHLHELSIVDELTGLYNRRGFLLHAEQQLLLAQRTKRNLLVFYADLDGLKQINDQLGHIAGDKAIAVAADLLRDAFRTSDIKARLGGDEFAVLVVEAEEHDAQILITRLREQLIENNQSMSIGVVAFDAQHDISIDDLIARADQAMYIEKRKKPGRL